MAKERRLERAICELPATVMVWLCRRLDKSSADATVTTAAGIDSEVSARIVVERIGQPRCWSRRRRWRTPVTPTVAPTAALSDTMVERPLVSWLMLCRNSSASVTVTVMV